MLVALLAAQAKVMAERPAEDRQRLVCYSSDQVKLPLSLTATPGVPASEHTVPTAPTVPRLGLHQPSRSPWHGGDLETI